MERNSVTARIEIYFNGKWVPSERVIPSSLFEKLNKKSVAMMADDDKEEVFIRLPQAPETSSNNLPK